jgi:hypothetical protein
MTIQGYRRAENLSKHRQVITFTVSRQMNENEAPFFSGSPSSHGLIARRGK